MKNLAYFFLFMMVCFLTNCKKSNVIKEIDPEPNPTEQITESTKFLKGLTVQGSDKVVFDSLNRAFTITLPSDYKDDEIRIDLSMYEGVKLLDSNTNLATNDSTIKFAYKGSLPLGITLGHKDEWMWYRVFVETSGPVNVEMLSKEVPIKIGSINLPFKIISGVGTIPSRLDQPIPIVTLINRKTSASIQGIAVSDWKEVFFQNVEKMLNTDNLALEIRFPDLAPIAFENIIFTRGFPEISITNNTFVYSRKDTIKAHGGFFLPNEKYVVKLSNDYLTTPVPVNMQFGDMTSIFTTLPNDVPIGSYLISFYENEKLIGKSTAYISESPINYIETIWKGDLNLAFSRNTEKLSLKKGDVFYSKLATPQFAHGSAPASSFDEKLLPHLRLKSGSISIDLKPEIAVLSWPVAGASFSLGKYTVPADIQPGSYEVIPVFTDKKELKPYWSKLQIQ